MEKKNGNLQTLKVELPYNFVTLTLSSVALEKNNDSYVRDVPVRQGVSLKMK